MTKDLVTEGTDIILKNRETSEAILNTLTKKPTAIKKLLSVGATVSDIITIVESSNPGLTKTVATEVAEKLALLLQLI